MSHLLRVYFCSYDPSSAVCHYRMGLQARALARAGHECFVGSTVMTSAGKLVGVNDDRTLVRDIDLVVIQPGVGSQWDDIFDTASKSNQKVVLDLDDWWLDAPGTHRDPESDKAELLYWRQTLPLLVKRADLVTASTQYIFDSVCELRGLSTTRLLRNPVDLARFGPPEDVSDGPVIGYAGSLAGHTEDVSLLAGWLDDFLVSHDLRVVHFGAHKDLPSFADVAHVDPSRVDERPGVPWDQYAKSRPMAKMDIGLVPLAPRPFNLAKSALKGMEYAACGVPFLAGSTPEYELLAPGPDSLVGTSLSDQGPDFWLAALERLLDPEARIRIATAQGEKVARQDISKRWPEWEAAYLDACSAR